MKKVRNFFVFFTAAGLLLLLEPARSESLCSKPTGTPGRLFAQAYCGTIITLEPVKITGKSQPIVAPSNPPSDQLPPYYSGPPNSSSTSNSTGADSGSSASSVAAANIAEAPSDQSTNPACATANPVIISTGEKVKGETDFQSYSLYGFGLTRTYRSKSSTGVIFGPNWPSTLDGIKVTWSNSLCRITDGPLCYPRSATVREPNGTQYKYSQIGTTEEYKVYGAQSAGRLTFVGLNLWELYRDNRTYTFNAQGNLVSVSDGAAVSSRTYVSGKLSSFTPYAGAAINLTWTGNRVTSISDQAGNVWTYTYNANLMLETVTSPGANPDIRRYHYEDASDGKLLTGISNNGIRYSTYSYFPDKRVQVSGLTGGEERDTFLYGANQTVVTNALGQSTTHNFTTINGALKPTTISRAGSSSCAASSAQTVYDANGYIDYTLDWNGVKADYLYDATGKLLQVVSAAGTPQATSKNNLNP